MSGQVDRRAAVAALVAERDPRLLVVGGLGAPTWDLAAVEDHDLDFGLWGAMGGAAMIGLGLALARPQHRVLVITGDGEMLMGLGSLATVAAQKPANLAIAVLDNGRYGETGAQPTHTAMGTDLAAVARACGFPAVATVAEPERLGEAVTLARQARGPAFVVLKIAPGDAPLVLPDRDPVRLKDRFRSALAAEDA